jgi:hypothetical protein
MELRKFFDEMSVCAAKQEQLGKVDQAQQTRDRRNKLWDIGVRGEVKYRQGRGLRGE